MAWKRLQRENTEDINGAVIVDEEKKEIKKQEVKKEVLPTFAVEMIATETREKITCGDEELTAPELLVYIANKLDRIEKIVSA